MAGRTFYEILRVSSEATEDEIKAAYRALAWDREVTSNQDELKAINEAYATLSSPERRAAYDRSLSGAPEAPAAAPGPAPAAAPGRPAPAVPAEPDEDRIPKGPALLRFWGWVTEMSLGFRRAKYYFLPLSWVLVVFVASFGIYLWTDFSDTVSNALPDKVAIHDLIQRVPDRKYVSVIGTSDKDWAYENEDNKKERYYWLWMGDEAMLIRGDGSRYSGAFVGLLRPVDGELYRLVKEDAAEAAKAGIPVLTSHYLDTTFSPKAPGWFYAGFAFVLLALVVLIVPGLLRYVVFRADHRLSAALSAPNTAWPVSVEATGTFRPEGRRGLPHFDALHSSLLTAHDEGGHKVLAQFGKGGYYQILIPPGSHTQIGLDHTGGQTKAGLRVRAGGQTIYLRVASMKLARELAAAIETSR
ncbi:MAG: dnaJ1 [Symbiobacteriaceae bacterium]|jgi:curved DNA-binding protein CbpA|nr:dnaJ1 [Symbiobacteriaceae bacterium]